MSRGPYRPPRSVRNTICERERARKRVIETRRDQSFSLGPSFASAYESCVKVRETTRRAKQSVSRCFSTWRKIRENETKREKNVRDGNKEDEERNKKRRGDSQAVCKARSNLVIESGLAENVFNFATFLLFPPCSREAKKRETWRGKTVVPRSFLGSLA